jgi:hypothetical protein
MARRVSRPSRTAAASTAALIDTYEREPEILARAIAGMTPGQLKARPIKGKWSTLEVVCHLADSEQVYADRIKRTIAMPRPLLISYDESLYAQHLAYHRRDAGDEVESVRMVRRMMARILRTLPASAWERQAVHNEAGLKTLRELVQGEIDHLRHHVGFIKAKRRALGIVP